MIFRISIPNCFQFRMIKDVKDILFGSGGDIHYIGGAEILPAPFDAEEESMWLKRLETPSERSEAIAVLCS